MLEVLGTESLAWVTLSERSVVVVVSIDVYTDLVVKGHCRDGSRQQGKLDDKSEHLRDLENVDNNRRRAGEANDKQSLTHNLPSPLHIIYTPPLYIFHSAKNTKRTKFDTNQVSQEDGM